MPVLVYSVLRLALFAVTTAVLWWAGMRSWLAPLLAAFLAWGLSYVLLSGPRDAAALHLARRAEERRAGRVRGRAADDAAAEDAELDAVDGDDDPTGGTSAAAAPVGGTAAGSAADVTADVTDADEATRRDPA